MKTKMNIKSIMIMAIICLASMFFINICLAADTGKINVDTAKLREEANTEAKTLELVSLGEEVEILEEVDGWYKVKYKKITGYIRKDLVQLNNNQENTTIEDNIIESKSENNQENENTAIETTAPAVEENNNIEKGKYKILKDTEVKFIPLISSIQIEEAKKDEEVEVTEIINDWAKITKSNGKQGWVIKDNLTQITETTTVETAEINKEQQNNDKQESKEEVVEQQKTETKYVNVETANVRKEPNKTSGVLKQLSMNEAVEVIDTNDGWATITLDGKTGYISESLLSKTKQTTSRSATNTRKNEINTTETTEQTTEETKTTSSNNIDTSSVSTDKGNSVVSYAKQFLGCKYVYGGTTTSGFDCSGFTQFVYKHFGISLNRTASAQYSNGTAVSTLQAGDLVMFGKSGINHVGIYIGGNTFIHAANTKRGVTTDTLSTGYYKTNYVGARRIF